MELKLSDKTLRSIILYGSSFLLGYCVGAAYSIWKKRQFKTIDEGFEDVSQIEENPEVRILVLGLENAGKSTILSQISSDNASNSKNVKPTEGFNVTTKESNGVSINIWEIGGRDSMRVYWPHFLQDTDILVFVVDASDIHSLSLAVKELKWLLADDRLAKVPVLLIANKQDIPHAFPPQQVADALDLGSILPSEHKIRVIGTQTPPNATVRHPSIAEVEKTLLLMIND